MIVISDDWPVFFERIKSNDCNFANYLNRKRKIDRNSQELMIASQQIFLTCHPKMIRDIFYGHVLSSDLSHTVAQNSADHLKSFLSQSKNVQNLNFHQTFIS